MSATKVMRELKSLGNERALTTYRRHGIEGEAFGVSYADLYKLQKRLGGDQKLAEALWATGNHDARVLATLIADPEKAATRVLDSWAKAVTSQVMSDAVASVAGRNPKGQAIAEKWMKAKGEWVAATGWGTISHLLASGAQVPPAAFRGYLKTIGGSIHESPNRVRHSMNGALIALGGGALQKEAIATAKKIGKVEVDHGNTACKTPDAASYIKKVAAHASKKKTAKKKTAKKKTSAKARAR